MNIYIIIFISLHIIILLLLLLNIFFSSLKLSIIKKQLLKNEKWFKDNMRARHFFVQSILSFLFAMAGEAFSFWCLWMADVFK